MTQNLLPSLTNSVNGTVVNIAGETFWTVLPVNFTVSHTDLVAALNAANLDPALSKNLATSYAFNRAVSTLSRGKLRDRVEWSQDRVSIQVSARVHVPDGIDYVREGTVTLDRATGSISCPDPVVKAEAERLFNEAMGRRNGRDVMNMLDRIMRPSINKAVFPMKGGVFFALSPYLTTLDNIEKLINAIGGKMMRWQIADGTPQTVSQVQTVVVDSFAETMLELENHIGTVNSESRGDKVTRVKEALEDLQARLRYNANRVGDKLSQLEDHLAYCTALLNKNEVTAPKVEVVVSEEETAETTPESMECPGYEATFGCKPGEMVVDVVIGKM